MFTVMATIPIAMFMGVYMRHIRPGRIAISRRFSCNLAVSGFLAQLYESDQCGVWCCHSCAFAQAHIAFQIAHA